MRVSLPHKLLRAYVHALFVDSMWENLYVVSVPMSDGQTVARGYLP